MSAPFQLGTVGHFALAVCDPRASADWYVANLGMTEVLEFDSGVASKARSSRSCSARASRHGEATRALAFLKERHVDLEDPGDEICPEVPGSRKLALRLHDPDRYRLELSVQNGVGRM